MDNSHDSNEPVAERFEKMHANGDVWITTIAAAAIARNTSPQPAQPSKPWVGLTSEERDAILNREFKQWWSRHDAVCRAIEAKLREKNA